MSRSRSGFSVGLTTLVVAIVLGTALALWFYVREPEPRAAPRASEPERDASLDGAGLTQRVGPELARAGG
jgi:hypothetical protein